MEVKKVLSELEIANDINVLSIEELEEKYLSDGKKYGEFLEKYATYFTSHLMYQLRVVDQYEKIAELLYEGNQKYTDSNYVELFEKVLSGMETSSREYRVSGARVDDKYEALYLFNSTITPEDSISTRYIDLVDGIYHGALEYSKCSNDSINDLFLTLYYKLKKDNIDKNGVEEIVKQYSSEHNMMDLCNNKNFLYFANYMMSQNRSQVDVKFIDDVKNVIKTSEFLQNMGFVDEDLNKNEYNKLAQFTIRNFAKYRKLAKQKEDQGISKALRIKRNSNK
jgi:hypothetical protein